MTTLNIPCGQKRVAMSTKYVVMSWYHMILYGTLGLLYIKTHIYEVWNWKFKTKLLFNFDHLKHSMWSSSSGHEHKICGHEYTIYVLTLYSCDISKHTFIRSGSWKKTVLFNFDHFKHSLWSSNSGHEPNMWSCISDFTFWHYMLVIYQNTHL